MKQIAEECNIFVVGIGKTIRNSLNLPVKQLDAHLKGNYPVNLFMHCTNKNPQK